MRSSRLLANSSRASFFLRRAGQGVTKPACDGFFPGCIRWFSLRIRLKWIRGFRTPFLGRNLFRRFCCAGDFCCVEENANKICILDSIACLIGHFTFVKRLSCVLSDRSSYPFRRQLTLFLQSKQCRNARSASKT